MRLDRSIKVQRELEARIREIYSESVHFARTHKEHLERMNKLVWTSDVYRHAPRWLHTFLHGVDHTYFNMLYSVSLTFKTGNKSDSPLCSISIGPDGRKYGPNDDTWLAESSEYKSNLKCEHVWRDRWEKGEYKPW